MSLEGKNVIITGATSGLGVEIAAILSGEGANVFIGGRRADSGAKVAADTKSTFHVVNVADEESNKTFFAAAEKHFDGQNVDYVLLNAGVEGKGEETVVPNNLTVKNYDYVFGVNVRGIVLGLQYGTPLLRKNGTILCTSSVVSIMPMGLNPVYAASKATVDSLVRSYAAQFADSEDERIKTLSVMAINPALYITEMSTRFFGDDDDLRNNMAKMFNPSQRPGKAEELAATVRDLMSGKLDEQYKSGATIACDADTHFPVDEFFARLEAGKTEAA